MFKLTLSGCETQKKASTRTYSYCEATFTQEYNQNRHIRKKHQENVVTFVESVTETIEITHKNEDNNNEKILNASFVNENGEVINLNIFVIMRTLQ